jgi:AraC family transcriptional regulator
MLSDYRIRRALAYIDDDTERDLSLNVLARVAAMSPFHFHRQFREVTGKTVHGYVQRKRLERATYDLAFTARRVSDIAAASGYRSAAAFSRAFRKVIGIAPTRIRGERGWMPTGSASFLPSGLRVPRYVLESARKLSFIEQSGTIVEATGKAWEMFASAELGADAREVIGMCPDYPGVSPAGRMRYQVGVPLSSGRPERPAVTRQLPGGWYAVFVHRGRFNDMKRINELWGEIYTRWPENGTWDLRSNGSYESYPVPRGQTSHQIGEVELHVPVQRRVIVPA